MNRWKDVANERPAPLLIRPREAARILAISERTLHDLTKTGNLTCVRVGGAKRYSVAVLRAWVDAKSLRPSQ